MPEPVEVAIESALLTKAQAFAAAQSPALAISLPNVAFPGKNPNGTDKPMPVTYLQASFLPAPSFELGIGFGSNNQHYGILQLSYFCALNLGEYAPGRVASSIIQHFARGTVLEKDGVQVRILKQPYRSSMLIEAAWAQIPVSIPYTAYAPPA